jgi:hypothetical protein
MMAERGRRPVRAVPDPKPQPDITFYDGQMRVVFGGEPMHLTLCGFCCAVVPSGAKAQARHLLVHRMQQEVNEAALPR